MKIKLIDPESDNIPTALGISRERTKELDELIETDTARIFKAVMDKNNPESVTEQMERLTGYSKHPNETAYLCYHIGVTVGKLQAMVDNPMRLIGLMVHLMKGKDGFKG